MTSCRPLAKRSAIIGPNIRSSSPSRRGAALKQLLDAVEDRGGDTRLALKRDGVGTAAPDNRDGVGVHLEAGVGARHVVGDDEVRVLPLPLGPSPCHAVFG